MLILAKVIEHTYSRSSIKDFFTTKTNKKNHPTLAYKNSVRKCYQDQVLLFSRNIQFNNPTSIPQT